MESKHVLVSKVVTSLLLCVGIVWGSYYLGKGVENKGRAEGSIAVKGLGSQDFTADLIALEGYFSVENDDLQLGFAESSRQKDELEAFLVDLGIPASEITFQAATYSALERSLYNDTGKFIGYEPYYRLTQDFEIRSNDVASVERASRKISDVLDKGILINMSSPRYYYTKLADLKHEMIKKATEDARQRAEIIAAESGGSLGELRDARMGVFQITGQYSDEDYSWGGSFNTADKEKTATITINLTYESN